MMDTLKFILPILGILLALASCNNQEEPSNYKKELPSYNDTLDKKQTKTPQKVQKLEVPKILPVNELNQNATLKATVEQMHQVVKDKDVAALMDFIQDDIKVSFGGAYGHSGFRKYWSLNSTEANNSEVWQELNTILSLGGTFVDNDNFSMPYIFTKFPEEYDPFEYSAITGENVRMRDQPSLDGKILDALSYEIVKVTYDENPKNQTINGETYPWVEIIRRNEQKGYVYGKFVRSPIDYRLNFTKINGEWKMNFFVVGD
jgi:hypothetical protein